MGFIHGLLAGLVVGAVAAYFFKGAFDAWVRRVNDKSK